MSGRLVLVTTKIWNMSDLEEVKHTGSTILLARFYDEVKVLPVATRVAPASVATVATQY